MSKMTKKTRWVWVAVLAITLAGHAQSNEPAAAAEFIVVAEEGVPGGAVINTLALQAKVVGINYETREISLLLPGGVTEVLTVGPEAVNFGQIKTGDMVKALVTEELVIGMGSADAELEDGEDAVILAAAPGENPGGIAADTVRMTATVVGIDSEARTATLRFEDGREKTVAVRDDIDLTKRSVGEKVVFQISSMVAISVEKQ